MVNVVYLAFGPRRVVKTTVFSALTLAAAASGSRPWRLVVYTDQERIFERYGVSGEFVSLDDIESPTEDHAYPHRIKILALRHCAEHFDGDLVYLDGDTYFVRPAEELFARIRLGESVMHEREWLLSDAKLPRLSRVLTEADFGSPTFVRAYRRPDLAMWNAGLIGIADANKSLVADVLEVADELFGAYGFYIVEQLAWSIVLHDRTRLSPADDIVVHYWGGREELTYRIVAFLRASEALTPNERVAAAHAFRPQPTAGWRPPLSVRVRRAARAGRRLLRTPPGLVSGTRAMAKQSEVE